MNPSRGRCVIMLFGPARSSSDWTFHCGMSTLVTLICGLQASCHSKKSRATNLISRDFTLIGTLGRSTT